MTTTLDGDTSPDDVIWSNTVDSGTWQVKVTRIDRSHGLLEVIRIADQETILREQVVLAYGAIFGPDIDDVSQWQLMALRAIDDNQKKEHNS